MRPGTLGSADQPFSVCVFCGSRMGASPTFAEAAGRLGEEIGRRHWRLVYGGGDVGLMGVVARAAQSSGAEVAGIIPRLLLEREVGKRDISELVVTDTMFERKQRMIAQSHAFVTLPGGLGTLDELLEVVTLKQLGYVQAPLLLVDLEHIWEACAAAFEAAVRHGFAEPSALDLYELVPTVEAALARLDQAAGG